MANTSSNSGAAYRNLVHNTRNDLPLVEAVRSLAYAIYEYRGRTDGHDLDDWLRAERQVFTRRGLTPSNGTSSS